MRLSAAMTKSRLKFMTVALPVLLLAALAPATQAQMNYNPWRVDLSLSGHLCLPSGGYYEGRDPGVGFDVDLAVVISRKFALRGTVTSSGIKAEDGLAHPLEIAPDEYLMFDDYQFSSMGYFLSLAYCRQLSRETAAKMSYRMFFGFGVVTHKTEVDDVHIIDGAVVSRNPVSISENLFANTIGGVITYRLSPVVGIHGGINFDFVWPKNAGDHDEHWDVEIGSAHRFNLKAGLTLFVR